MESRNRIGFEVIVTALALGILADSLFRETPWGISIPIFASALSAVFLYLKRRNGVLDNQSLPLVGGLLFLSGLFVWRDSEQLRVLDVLAMLVLLAVLMLPSLRINVSTAGIIHYLIGAAWSWLSAVFAPLLLVFKDINPPLQEQSASRRTLVSALRGFAAALPLLLIFGALFTSADAGFEGLVDSVFQMPFVETIFEHAVPIGVMSWFAAGYLRNATSTSVFADEPSDLQVLVSDGDVRIGDVLKGAVRTAVARIDLSRIDNSMLPRALSVGAVEVGVVLGLVNLLFIVFVGFQLPYLFGGFEFVQATPDFKLSEYARRGFGELIAVAVLVAPMLLASHWLLRGDDKRAEKLYRILAVLQIALLFVIMSSAMHRLLLLTGSLGYGMTTQRFYAMVFIVWFAIAFVWFILTILRGKRERFATGVLISALVSLGILHAINPDRFIARVNIELMSEGRPFDGVYNGRLSNDAVPELLEALPMMDFEQQCHVKRALAEKLGRLEEQTSPLVFHFSNSRARQLLSARRQDLNSDSCGSVPVIGSPVD